MQNFKILYLLVLVSFSLLLNIGMSYATTSINSNITSSPSAENITSSPPVENSPSLTEDNSPDVERTGSVSITIPEGASIPGNPPYVPTDLSVKKGETVTVVNNDNAPHTATSGNGPDDAGQVFDTSLLMAGESETIDTSTMEPGEYPYFCTVHPFQKGTLTVTTG